MALEIPPCEGVEFPDIPDDFDPFTDRGRDDGTCKCYANGGENEAFCQDGTLDHDPFLCESLDGRCHWGPGEIQACVDMVQGNELAQFLFSGWH